VEFPGGDAGGNAFPLKYHYDVDELHALWDTVIYKNHNSQPMPFTADSWAAFGVETAALKKEWSIPEKEVSNLNWYSISKETHELGTYVYDGIFEELAVP